MEIGIDGLYRKKCRDNLDECIDYYKEEILKVFGDKVDFIALTGSFSTGEESYFKNGDSDSDVDFFVGLKDGTDMKHAIKQGTKLANALNQKRNPKEPKFSIWLDTTQNFLNGKSDTITPYQINETRKVLYGTLGDIPKKPIEFNSQVGLLGVSYAQLLSGVNEKNYKNLAKGVFNQIGTILIKDQKYSTSYEERIKRFLELHKEFNISREDFYRLLELKFCPTEEVFIKNFGSIEHFMEIFSHLFTYQTIKGIFDEKGNLEDFCERMTNGTEIHTNIRMAFVCYYLKRFDLAEHYIGKIEQILKLKKSDKLSLDRINNVWNYRLQHELGVI